MKQRTPVSTYILLHCLQVNAAFEELRIRARAGSGRLPKLEILRAAIQHIERLQAALRAAAVVSIVFNNDVIITNKYLSRYN